ncbi:helix-turn-helix domain-containing protein [Streptomyces chartreusis]|uniref:helix-turn-helix domain-containing protein n=1 Tax=Streptomyces chartreusis TaxID=1969 RepID=UPI003801FFCC
MTASTTTAVYGEAGRPGRRLTPLGDMLHPEHREWLMPLRMAYEARGLTYMELASRAYTTPPRLSAFLNGKEGYPTLERVLAVHKVLQPEPSADWFREAWQAGAVAVGRSDAWIQGRVWDVDRKRNQVSRSQAIKLNVLACFAGMVTSAVIGLAVVTAAPDDKGEAGCKPGYSCVTAPAPGASDDGGSLSADSPGTSADPPATSAPPTPAEDREYITIPRPKDTMSLAQAVALTDIPVYQAPGTFPADRQFIEHGDKFYVSCRDDQYLRIAGTDHYVSKSEYGLGFADSRDVSSLPHCSAPSAPSEE